MNNFEKLIILFIICIIAVIVFMGFDAGMGASMNAVGHVADKRYNPAWVETQVQNDGNGGVSVNTIYHSEEWHAQVDFSESLTWARVTKEKYDALRENQKVIVHYRTGKWTGWRYVKEIDEDISSEH